MADFIFINNPRFSQFLKVINAEDTEVILALCLLMCDTNKDREVLVQEDVAVCVDVYGKERTNSVLAKWFVHDIDDDIYTPLVSIFDFLRK